MINKLTITQLVENRASDPGLLGEHGIAFFIEADGHCLLFDTGQGLALRKTHPCGDWRYASAARLG